MWDRHGTLIDLPKRIHLLHVLPAGATRITRTGLEHFDVIEPEPSSTDVNANTTEDELVSLSDGLSVLAGLVSGQVEASSNEVDV
jgi:hypothetical protein